MQWLYNFSTKGKILTLTVFMLILMGIVGFIGIKASSDINDAVDRLYQNEALGISYIKEANISLIYASRAMRNILLAQADSRIDQNIYKQAKDKYTARTEEYLAKAAPLFYTEAGKAKIAEIKQAFEVYKSSTEAAFKLAAAEEAAGIAELKRESVYKVMTEVRTVADKVDNLMTEASEVKEANAKRASDDTTEMYQTSRNMMLLVIAIATLLGLLIGYLVGNRMGRNAQAMADTMIRVGRDQDFSARAIIADKDELGQAGDALNGLLAQLQAAIVDSNRVVGAIAAGDFSQRVTNGYSGDLNQLKQGINNSADNISDVMNQIAEAMNAMANGQFQYQLNAQAPGAYGDMLVKASTAMSALDSVIADMNHAMSRMNEGDFDARVNADARGNLLSMKTNVNESMDRLAMAMNGITNIVTAQADGDLTQNLNLALSGQLKELQDAINASASKLKDIVAQAVEAATIVNEASGQVSQGSADLSSRVQEQAAALEETSATMHEMASAVQANTNNARKVADLAHQVQTQSVEGVSVMNQTIGAMQSIRESSYKISDIVSLIDGIAFQTNLLALNAAVEAARAGEHGRGFAVVAGEVRALAQKSAEAAKDIKTLIDDSVARVENGTQLAEKSGQMLSGITEAVEQVAGMIEEIATASHEQSQGIGQVHTAITQIDAVTQQNAALVEETTAAAESLSSEANHLRQNMSFFKTGAQQHRQVTHNKPSQSKVAKALPSPSANTSADWSDF